VRMRAKLADGPAALVDAGASGVGLSESLTVLNTWPAITNATVLKAAMVDARRAKAAHGGKNGCECASTPDCTTAPSRTNGNRAKRNCVATPPRIFIRHSSWRSKILQFSRSWRHAGRASMSGMVVSCIHISCDDLRWAVCLSSQAASLHWQPAEPGAAGRQLTQRIVSGAPNPTRH
jgi:hypothetical protein